MTRAEFLALYKGNPQQVIYAPVWAEPDARKGFFKATPSKLLWWGEDCWPLPVFTNYWDAYAYEQRMKR